MQGSVVRYARCNKIGHFAEVCEARIGREPPRKRERRNHPYTEVLDFGSEGEYHPGQYAWSGVERRSRKHHSEKVEWLGYELSAEGIKPTADKTVQIINLQAPKTVKQVRQILGIVNYYSRFLKNLATVAKPISALLEKNKKLKWTDTEEEALNQIKEQITKRSALAPFQTASEFKVRLQCDASEVGMGALLEQQQKDKEYKPIAYWSSLFIKHEMKYSIG